MDKQFEVVRFEEDGVTMDVKLDPVLEEAWLSLNDLSKLFGKDKSSLSRQVKNIINEGAVQSDRVVAKFATTGPDGKRYITTFYGLEMVLEIGRRIRSNRGELLRKAVQDYCASMAGDPRNSIIIYNNGNVNLSVRVSPDEDTVWLTQSQIAELFGTTQPNVSTHISNILESGELGEETIYKKSLYMPQAGRDYETAYYNLDMVLSIGYRVNSKRGIEFRRWASKVLRQYLLRGYALNSSRATVSAENFLRLENDVRALEAEVGDIKERLFVEPVREKLFFNGEFFDARSFIKDLLAQARRNIVLIDPYADIRALDYLKAKKPGVTIKLCYSSRASLTRDDVASFNDQFGGLVAVKNDLFHDRFIIVDDRDLYHLGTSLNHAGDKAFAVVKMSEPAFIESILQNL